MKQMNYEGAPVFGLDIGTRSVVGTVGYKDGDNFVVVAQEIREHKTRAMLDGQIHDISRVAATISEIKEALEEKTGCSFHEVCIAAAGRVLKTLNVNVEIEFDKERNVTKDDIALVASRGMEKAFAQFSEENESATNFYCVGYSVMKYYLNGMWMSQPEHHKAKTLGADLIATFLPDDVVDGLYRAVELADLKVANMTLEPIAAIRVAIPEKYRLLNIAMVDVGAGTSDVSITRDGSIFAFGMIPMAGDCMTEAIARHCLIDFVTAEKVKKAASTQEQITYEDIMGLEQTISSEEVMAICEPELDNMTEQIAKLLCEMNGGSSPSAVFIVGGGGKVKGYTQKLADKLGIDPKRVALRGEDIMNEIEFPLNCCKDSTIITPIGICLSYYEQNNNFVYVYFNGKKVKLYDNNKLSVIDAAIQAAFDKDGLFPRRGQDLNYTVNGKKRVTKGEYGESAEIYVNEVSVNINHEIKPNDRIVMEPATAGKDAELKISDLIDYKAKLKLMLNNEAIELPKPVKVNGVHRDADYQIQQEDEIVLESNLTYEQLMAYMPKEEQSKTLYVNGEEATADTRISSGDELYLFAEPEVVEEPKVSEETVVQNESTASPEEKQETAEVFRHMVEQEALEEKTEEKIVEQDTNRNIMVIVNQRPVSMKGKKEYCFVDIFDYINFDTTRAQGSKIVTLINGRDAQYMEPLKTGDKIEVFWKD